MLTYFLFHAFCLVKPEAYITHNATQTATVQLAIRVCYATIGKCSLKQRWGAGYRGLIRSVQSNATATDLFHFKTSDPTNADSSDITWGILSDFTQKHLYNFFTYAVVLPKTCKQTLMWKTDRFRIKDYNLNVMMTYFSFWGCQFPQGNLPKGLIQSSVCLSVVCLSKLQY